MPDLHIPVDKATHYFNLLMVVPIFIGGILCIVLTFLGDIMAPIEKARDWLYNRCQKILPEKIRENLYERLRDRRLRRNVETGSHVDESSVHVEDHSDRQSPTSSVPRFRQNRRAHSRSLLPTTYPVDPYDA
ncbi:hypothetical protein JR316_0004996 [Psilocybe cubensis]|uniref:Uncharacterized protein n=2 Tax=Psilocybe cubensis TaxID=181762 RepID=A0ACB8H4W8_PSICU|nr:hypothetical protein JR316_0004996 [Psilocybe cubensis]KAH9482896.1 hypothetical protein JR316_0004996 [Psilocybe cubensis]